MNTISKSATAASECVTSHVNGQSVPSSSSVIELRNPATGAAHGCLAEADHATLDKAVRSARAEFDGGSWHRETPGFRAKCLRRLADRIESARDELGRLDTEDMGKPIANSIAEAAEAADMLRAAAARAEHLLGKVYATHHDVHAYSLWEPVGVVGAITPWNYPMPNLAHKLGPALAVGNAVVLKPSEVSSRSAVRVAQLASEAGLPPGVLQVVLGRGETIGRRLAMHPGVDMLSFTGSTQVGRQVLIASGESNGKRVMIECGGKSPQIVFDDVDSLDTLAPVLLGAAFANSGQLCVAKSRLLVHARIADALSERLAECLPQFLPGDPADRSTRFGPIAFERQYRRVNEIIDSARKEGLPELHAPAPRGLSPDGLYISPVIFRHVEDNADVGRKEVFGPVLTMTSFTDDRHAIELANDTEYGLSASVWTRNAKRAAKAARAIRAGSIDIYTGVVQRDDLAPAEFSSEPAKASGFGIEGGIEGLESYCYRKGVCTYYA